MTEKSKTSQAKQNSIFFNIIITCIATTMMSTALATALPPITSDLNISVNTAQWLSSGYYLCMGIMVPVSAFLISRFSTKKLYLSVLGIFIVGLFFCLIATNFPIMMLGRILQAGANGVLSPLGQVVLLTIYPPEKKGSIMGWYGLSLGAAPVLAPTIVGLLIDIMSWRMVFVLPLIIMIASFIIAVFVFENVIETSRVPFHAVSFFSCLLTFGGITFGIGNIGTCPFFSIWIALPLVIGLVAGAFFIYCQLHEAQPFLELRTFSNRHFTMSVFGSMILYITTMSSVVLLPLYVQNIEGYSATISGLVTLPGSLVMAVISPVAGKIYDKIGMKCILLIGTICLLFSNFGMYFIKLNSPLWIAALLNVFRQSEVGCLLMTFVAWGTESLPQNYISHGTVLLTSLRTIAGSAGMSLSVGIMTLIAGKHGELTSQFAEFKGLNTAFFMLGITNLILLIIFSFVIMEKKKL